MPVIQVYLLEGRSEEVKSTLARELTAAVERSLGSDPERVQVLINSVAGGDWFRAGTALGLPGEQPS